MRQLVRTWCTKSIIGDIDGIRFQSSMQGNLKDHLISNCIFKITGEALIQPYVIPILARYKIAEEHVNQLKN